MCGAFIQHDIHYKSKSNGDNPLHNKPKKKAIETKETSNENKKKAIANNSKNEIIDKILTICAKILICYFGEAEDQKKLWKAKRNFCYRSTGKIEGKNIKDIIPFHSQKMMLKSHVIPKELDPCMDEKISMHIVPKCVPSICLKVENLQQLHHTCFP